jgi:hypothetical protein
VSSFEDGVEAFRVTKNLTGVCAVIRYAPTEPEAKREIASLRVIIARQGPYDSRLLEGHEEFMNVVREA